MVMMRSPARPKHTHRQRGRLAAWLGRFAVIAGLVTVTLASNSLTSMPYALAAGTSGPGGFGLAPASARNGQAPAYFSLALRPGKSAATTAVLSNGGASTETVDIGVSLGVTAVNGGAAYTGLLPRCTGTACWISGLPRRVTLAAGAHRLLRFTVRVPARTRAGQYLAGLSASMTTPPGPVQAAGPRQVKVKAVVILQVSVGVAVTVGRLSKLKTLIRIHGVTSQDIGPTARLNISLSNAGQTFTHANGTVTCTRGSRSRSFAVKTGEILPGDTSGIAVNAPGLPEGVTLPCSIRLRYGARQAARWSGRVTIPMAPRIRIVHNGLGSYADVPTRSGLMSSLIAPVTLGVLALSALGLLLWRRRSSAVKPGP